MGIISIISSKVAQDGQHDTIKLTTLEELQQIIKKMKVLVLNAGSSSMKFTLNRVILRRYTIILLNILQKWTLWQSAQVK